MTGVTAPLIRIHPVIIAQAVATVADMLPGRFLFGVGTGEYLNEHITGAHWPPISRRQDMLVEALAVIRNLWQGGYTTHYGQFYTVENARLYTLPEKLPPIYIAAAGPESAVLAGKHGDGLINTSPDAEVVQAYLGAGGEPDPVYGQITVCWADDKDTAAETALDVWGYTALPGQMSQELALPMYYEAGKQLVTTEMIKESIVCGPDPDEYHQKIQAYVDAGYTHVYLHQVGPDQEGFFDFAKRELLPAYS
jgi:G6PDH family F420-dependent oxidoreductase